MKTEKFEVGGPKATYVLIVCSTLYMVNYMDRQVLSVVLEPMKIDLGLSDAQAGWIQTGFLLSMGLCSIPISYFVDRWRRNGAIGVMAIVWSAATFCTGLGRSFIGVFIPRILTGTGEAAFSSGAIALISASYPPGVRAKKMGVYNMFLIFGVGLGMILGGYLSKNYGGWRTPFYVFAAPGVLLGILAFFMQDYPNPPRDSSIDKNPSFYENAKKALKIPTMRWLFVGWGMHNLMSFAFLVWAPALIMRRFDVTEDVAGLVMAAAGALSVPGSLFGGTIADAWQRKHPAGRMRFAAMADAVSSTAIIIALIFIFVLHQGSAENISVWLVLGILFYAVFTMGTIAGIPAVSAVTQDVVSTELKGLAYGLSMFFMYLLGGGWSPALTGYLSDFFGGDARGLTYALMITGASGYLGFVFWWISSKHYPADARKVNQLQPQDNFN